MSYFDDSAELIAHCKQTFIKIKRCYNDSLQDKTIKISLLIEIKNFMENLRSALDYSAHGLYDKYGDKSKNAKKIYFPYAWNELDEKSFKTQKIVEQKIPGLSKFRPDIVAKIESYQHFTSANNAWLPIFMDLNNKNKHQQLTPQTKKETKQLIIKSSGGSISMGEGTSINMSPGTILTIGNSIIPGGQQFDANNPPTVFGDASKEIIIWVSFHFSTNNEPVIPLLEKSLVGIEKITNELSIL